MFHVCRKKEINFYVKKIMFHVCRKEGENGNEKKFHVCRKFAFWKKMWETFGADVMGKMKIVLWKNIKK